MGSQTTANKSKAHANAFDSQGRVVDGPTALKNAVATNAAKLNAILAALKAAGLMA